MWILDAGAGGSKAYPFLPMAVGENVVYLDVKRPMERIKNFIVACIYHLPFRDVSFNRSFASHVLEHVSKPNEALDELLRVTSKQIEIRVPHPKHPNAWRDPNHKFIFDASWFNESLPPSYGLTVIETAEELIVKISIQHSSLHSTSSSPCTPCLRSIF